MDCEPHSASKHMLDFGIKINRHIEVWFGFSIDREPHSPSKNGIAWSETYQVHWFQWDPLDGMGGTSKHGAHDLHCWRCIEILGTDTRACIENVGTVAQKPGVHRPWDGCPPSPSKHPPIYYSIKDFLWIQNTKTYWKPWYSPLVSTSHNGDVISLGPLPNLNME